MKLKILPRIALPGLVLLAACGSSKAATTATVAPTTAAATTAAPTTPAPTTAAPTTAMSMATAYPLTITNCGRQLAFKEVPKRVVILNGTSVGEVETFIALGLQDRIAANSQSYGVSDDPNMVAAIAKLPTGGVKLNENFEVPREQLLALNPDLVISTWAGGFSEKVGSISRDDLSKLGINSYVPPSNCAYGAESATDAEKAALTKQSYKSSYDLVNDLGKIFDIQEKAMKLVSDSEARIAAVSKPVGNPPAHVLIAFPGMGMMNANGLPAVFGGSLYDSIITAAGGENSFKGMQFTDMASITAEQLAAAQVDVIAVGLFQPAEKAELYAQDLFKAYPQWNASKNQRYVVVSDSIYLGPLNSLAIEKLAKAIATVA